jgi:hypothetical protein
MAVNRKEKTYTVKIDCVNWTHREDPEILADRDVALRLVMRRLHYLYARTREPADVPNQDWLASEVLDVFDYAKKARLKMKDTITGQLIYDMAATVDTGGGTWYASSIDCQYIPCDPYEYVFDMETHKRLGND